MDLHKSNLIISFALLLNKIFDYPNLYQDLENFGKRLKNQKKRAKMITRYQSVAQKCSQNFNFCFYLLNLSLSSIF